MPVDSHLFKSVQTVSIIRLEGQQGGEMKVVKNSVPTTVAVIHHVLRIETSV